LIHHCDHHPSLGNTINDVHHVDFTDEMAATCSTNLNRRTRVLPLYVPDGGKKVFLPISGRRFSAVTSGAYVKYSRTGEISLQNIARTVLGGLDGNFFHIGAIDSEWIAEVHAHLVSVGIDPDRFVALGGVASVWRTLLSLDAQVYIGSAPTGGGRAATEAQGCGYPLLYYRVTDQGPALGSNSLYANKQLGWSTMAELSELLGVVASQHTQMSETARLFYEQHCSRTEFVRILDEICVTR
jgi:hypothetical protein